MSKAVRIKTLCHICSQFLLRKFFPIQKMPDHRFSTWNIRIGLHPHSSNYFKPTFLNLLPQFHEFRKAVFLQPFPKRHTGRGQCPVIKLVHSHQRGGKRRFDFLVSLCLFPQPHRINMCITYHFEIVLVTFIYVHFFVLSHSISEKPFGSLPAACHFPSSALNQGVFSVS